MLDRVVRDFARCLRVDVQGDGTDEDGDGGWGGEEEGFQCGTGEG